MTKVTEHKTKIDWATFLADIAARYEDATRITLVTDNLSPHRLGALYEAPTVASGGDGVPTEAAGTFASQYGDIGRMMGAFGAHKQ